MPRINLLPWREAERKRKRQEFVLSLGAAVATAALVALLGRWQMSAAISHQERNKALSDQIAQLDKQIEEINGLDAQKRRLLARMEIIETLQRSRPEIVHIFDEIVRILPEGVYLTHLKESGTRFEIHGVAQSSTRVSTFMRNIEASEWLADPELQIVDTRSRDAAGGASFTLFANQRSHASPDQQGDGTGKKVAAK
jgi:type IV pilus assembly protein PilN